MILAFLEIRDGKIKKSSLESLSEAVRQARVLGVPAEAVVVGNESGEIVSALDGFGADKVHVLESPELQAYSSQGYALALEALVRETNPLAVFFPATAMGRDLAPRLAARLGVSLASDCTSVSVSDGRLTFTRPVYAGKALITVALPVRPAIATLRPNVFTVEREGGAGAEIVKKTVAVAADAVKGKVVEILGESGAAVDVAGAAGMPLPDTSAMRMII